MAKQIEVGSAPFVELQIGRFYIAQDGKQYDTASAAGDKYTADAAYNIKIGVPELSPELTAKAILGHVTRKAQEFFGSAYNRDKDTNMEELAEKFIPAYMDLLAGTRQERGERAVRVQTPEQVATNNIAQALRARKNLKAKDALEMAKTAAGDVGHPGHKAWEKELARVKKLMETDVEGF